jgi:hypothetical protein
MLQTAAMDARTDMLCSLVKMDCVANLPMVKCAVRLVDAAAKMRLATRGTVSTTLWVLVCDTIGEIYRIFVYHALRLLPIRYRGFACDHVHVLSDKCQQRSVSTEAC